ncbi:hypothetical protein AX16_007868 [Volvariella volvacea WC 439]|nr:hypothetical protein AX16_007868 [Volvariella volvacea WC 439]
MPSSAALAEVDALYPQIQRRLLESGDWNRLHGILAAKLNEIGWTDILKSGGKDRAQGVQMLSARALIQELKDSAQVPENVKDEVMVAIRQYLQKQFE